MAVIAVPAESAQEVAAAVVAAGITGILNFAPTKLEVPEHVHLQNVDLSIEIEYLSYLLTHEAPADT
jgi:redox-sensing transcriptional repressor